VIANSEPLHFRGYRDTLAEEGIALTQPTTTRATSASTTSGRSRRSAGNRGVSWSGARIADLVARKAVRLEALERDVSVLFPGAADAIRRAARRDAGGESPPARAARKSAACSPANSCSAASNRDRRRGRHAGEQAGPGSVPARFGASGAGRGSPPRGGVRGHRRLAVGLESARAAGLHTVAVTTTYRSDELVADATIASLAAMDLDRLARLCSE